MATGAELDKPNNINESLKGLFVRPSIYSALAVLIYLVGKLFWWPGLILFVVFAFYVIVELLVNGFVLIFIALIMRLVWARLTDYRVLNSETLEKTRKPLGSLAGATGLVALVQLYYLAIVLLLGFYFSGMHHS